MSNLKYFLFSLHKDDDHRCSPETMDTSNNNNNRSSNNNNNHSDTMVANILQNKDLTVEVKPVRVKPVVLVSYSKHFIFFVTYVWAQ
jgi:hypothetical protein